MAVPYTFGTATAAIPLSQLDTNFATAITLGNTAVYLGNTTTSIGNLTLTNVTISSGSVTITDTTVSGNVTLSGGTANGVAYLNGSKVLTTGSALTFDGTNLSLLPSGYSVFGASSAEQMRLTSTGLGIGTSSPVSPLTVAGTSSINWIGGGSSTGTATIGTQGTGGSLFVQTPSVNASFASGLGVDGSYSGGKSVINLKALGVSSGGPYSADMAFFTTTNSTLSEKMRLDFSGNLGLGVTPSAWTSYKALQISGSAYLYGYNNDELGLGQGAYYSSGWKYAATGVPATWYSSYRGTHIWQTAPSGTAGNAISFTQAMTLDASGNLLVGTTSAIGGAKLSVYSNTSFATRGTTSTNAGQWAMYAADTGAKAWEISPNATNFYIADADFSNYAYLSQNPTAWQFGSDRRLKTDIVQLDYGLDTVMAMQPKRYKFIETGKVDIGFIAQELRDVVPEAVSGAEVEFSDNDTPQERAEKILGVGKETLIPVLVKAIQEQQAIITQLKARLDAANL